MPEPELAAQARETAAASVGTTCESTLYEISKQALSPIIESRPQLVVELGLLIAARQRGRRASSCSHCGATT